MKLNILLACFCLVGSLLHAQSDAVTPPRVEFTVNPFMLAYLSPNLGIRLQSKGKWYPEFYVAAQLPLMRSHGTYTPFSTPFTVFHGIGATVYGGVSKSSNGFGQSGSRLSLQFGVKAYQTGTYDYRAGIASGQPCGTVNHARVTLGPRVIFAHRFNPGQHAGIELFSGVGARVGYNLYDYTMEGDMEQESYCKPLPNFQPYLKQTLSVPITLHMGLNVVLH